eukprot:TRINITY_DN103369_c0_g1_i1.p1 TRINITY_DN103369_c0_g1~~TRINITY_DN103369_c0_g1_i1.p1  ORF type:complete len:826 (+),score=100.77 TRINITY_DN103369_c0_g1_i1:44-2479(+)
MVMPGGSLSRLLLFSVVVLLHPNSSAAQSLAEEDPGSFEPRRVQISELPVKTSDQGANCRLVQRWELKDGNHWIDKEWGADSITTTTTTTTTTRFVSQELTFDGDYAAVVTDRLKFLVECSSKTAPVMCADVKPGSIVLTLAGSSDDVKVAVSNIVAQGLTLPSFGTLRRAALVTTTQSNTVTTTQSINVTATQSNTSAGNSRHLAAKSGAGDSLPCAVAVYSDSLCHDLVESQENSSGGGNGPRWARISMHGRLELEVPASTSIACVRLRLGSVVDDEQQKVSEIRVRQKWDGKWQSDERFAVRWSDLGQLVIFRVHGALLSSAYICPFVVILVVALGAFHIVCHLKGSEQRSEIPRQSPASAGGTAAELPRAGAVLTTLDDLAGKRRSTPAELGAALVLTVELGLVLLCVFTHPFVSVPILVLTVTAVFLPTPCFVVYVFYQATAGAPPIISTTQISAAQIQRRKMEEDLEKRKKDFFEGWQKTLDQWHPKTAFTKSYESETRRYRQSFSASPELCCASIFIFFGKVVLCLLFIWPAYILHVSWFYLSDVFVTGMKLKWKSPAARSRPNRKASCCSILTGCVLLVLATMFRLLLSPVLYQKIVTGWNRLGPFNFEKATEVHELILACCSFITVVLLAVDVGLQPEHMPEGEKVISALAIAYSLLMIVRCSMKALCFPRDGPRANPVGAPPLPAPAQSPMQWVSNSWWIPGSNSNTSAGTGNTSAGTGVATNPAATKPSWRASLSNAWKGLSPSREEWAFQPGRNTLRAITRKSREIYNDWQEKREAKAKRKQEQEKHKMATAMGITETE